MDRKFLIRILYKSGQHMDFRCDEFSITPGREAEWKNAFPRPLHFSLDDIEAVWQLEPEPKYVGADDAVPAL